MIEGEEETASHLEEFVSANPDLFTADAFFIADGGNEEVGIPVLDVTTRGGVVLTIEVRTLEQPVHSGIFGGAAPDALMALIRVLATLHDDIGDVAVAGLQRDTWDGSGPPKTFSPSRWSPAGVTARRAAAVCRADLWSGPAVNVIDLNQPPPFPTTTQSTPRTISSRCDLDAHTARRRSGAMRGCRSITSTLQQRGVSR